MDDRYKREQCIDNLVQQIGWIEDCDAHKFPGWGHTVNAMRQTVWARVQVLPGLRKGGEVGMMETIIGIATGILGVISIFWCGYEVGKFRGLSKAEKIFDEAMDRRRANDG